MDSFLDPTTWALLLLLIGVFLLTVLTIVYRRREMAPNVRDIPAFSALRDELGRAAESGRPLHITLGSGGLGTLDTVSSLAGLQVLEGLVEAAVSYDVAPIVTVGDATLLPLAQDVVRNVYERAQITELYDPSHVRFIAPTSLAYAAAAVPLGAPEDVTATIVAGAFQTEVSLLADAGRRKSRVGAIAVDTAQASGAAYPVTHRLAVGEELYAAGAKVAEDKRYSVGLMAEDILRVLLVLAILGAAAWAVLST